jgi:hypothetical protein
MIPAQQKIESELYSPPLLEPELMNRGRQPQSFQYGRFQAVYLPKGGGWGVKRPRNDHQAQQ